MPDKRKKPACPKKHREGNSVGVGISGGNNAGPAKALAVAMADAIGQAKAVAALAALPACDNGCEEDGTAAGTEGPTKILVSVEIVPGLWLVVVRRFWFATRFCKPFVDAE